MRKRVWIPLGIAATAAIVITALPIAIERLAEGWLRDQGVPDPSIENVDFNPFTGLLRVQSADFSGSAGERGQIDLIEIDLEPSALFSRRAQVARFAMSGGRLDLRKLDEGRFRIGGLTLPSETGPAPPPDAAADPWGLGASDVSLSDLEISYRDERLDSRLKLRRLTLDRFATWSPEDATDLMVELDLDGAAIKVEGQAAPLARVPNAGLRLKVERFSVGAYPFVLEGTDLTELEGMLSLDLSSTLRYRQDASLAVEITGSAAIDEARIGLPLATASNGQLTWSGEINATLPGQPPAAIDLTGAGALKLSGFALRQRDKPIGLAAFEQVEIGDIAIEGLDQITVGRIDLQGLELLRGSEAPVWLIAATRIEGIDLGPAEMAIAAVSLEGSVLQIEREQDGELKLISTALADLAPPALADAPTPDLPALEAPAPAEESPPNFRLRLGSLEVGGQSQVRFQDKSVTPVLSSTFAINNLKVTGIDSAAPDQPLKVSFDIAQDDGATLVGQGDIWPFGQQLVAELDIALERIDLTQISSYLPGYHIQRGRLDLETRAKVTGDTLEVANSVVIEKLKLSGKAAEDQSLLAEGMAMPLDVALDLLRDGDDRITLELPISGSLSDPQFGTGDIVRVAMQNALQKAAVSYVKNALQPLGTILLIGKLAGKAARPRFEPVVFAPGNAELTPEARAYLDKIGQLMSERQGLSITFCGVSTLADRDYLLSTMQPPEAEIAADASPDAGADTPAPEAETPPPTFETERLELARDRGTAMHEYLATSKAIDPERLFRCRPTLEPDSELPARVEITL